MQEWAVSCSGGARCSSLSPDGPDCQEGLRSAPLGVQPCTGPLSPAPLRGVSTSLPSLSLALPSRACWRRPWVVGLRAGASAVFSCWSHDLEPGLAHPCGLHTDLPIGRGFIPWVPVSPRERVPRVNAGHLVKSRFQVTSK